MSAKFTPGEWSVSELPILDRDGETRLAKISIVAPRQDGQYSIFSVGKVDFSFDHPGFIPCDLEEAEANARLFAASKKMLEALAELLNEVEELIGESAGVAGLHLNGDIAPWSDLEEGGRFERLSSMSKARAAIAAATGEQQ